MRPPRARAHLPAGAAPYNAANERDGDVPFEEQLEGLQRMVAAGKVGRWARWGGGQGGAVAWVRRGAEIASGKQTNPCSNLPVLPCMRARPSAPLPPQVRHVGVSNETSYGVMRFVAAAEASQGRLPRICSIQNNYSLLMRGGYEGDLAEVCAPRQCGVSLLAYSPLAGGALTGKYILGGAGVDTSKARLNLFQGGCASGARARAVGATGMCCVALQVWVALMCCMVHDGDAPHGTWMMAMPLTHRCPMHTALHGTTALRCTVQATWPATSSRWPRRRCRSTPRSHASTASRPRSWRWPGAPAAGLWPRPSLARRRWSRWGDLT